MQGMKMDYRTGADRREILGGIAALAAATATEARAADAAGNVIIEWNQHMFSQNVAKFPYGARATYRPDAAKNPPDPLVAYQKRMKDEGIDRALFVQPEP